MAASSSSATPWAGDETRELSAEWKCAAAVVESAGSGSSDEADDHGSIILKGADEPKNSAGTRPEVKSRNGEKCSSAISWRGDDGGMGREEKAQEGSEEVVDC
jgi:hypothetical protein